MLTYKKLIDRDDNSHVEASFLFKTTIGPLARAEIEDAERDGSLGILFEQQRKEEDCYKNLERLFDFIKDCYDNDIDYDVIEWLKEFIEDEEKNAH